MVTVRVSGFRRAIEEVLEQWWPRGEVVDGLPRHGWQFQIHQRYGAGRYKLEVSKVLGAIEGQQTEAIACLKGTGIHTQGDLNGRKLVLKVLRPKVDDLPSIVMWTLGE